MYRRGVTWVRKGLLRTCPTNPNTKTQALTTNKYYETTRSQQFRHRHQASESVPYTLSACFMPCLQRHDFDLIDISYRYQERKGLTRPSYTTSIHITCRIRKRSYCQAGRHTGGGLRSQQHFGTEAAGHGSTSRGVRAGNELVDQKPPRPQTYPLRENSQLHGTAVHLLVAGFVV